MSHDLGMILLGMALCGAVWFSSAWIGAVLHERAKRRRQQAYRQHYVSTIGQHHPFRRCTGRKRH